MSRRRRNRKAELQRAKTFLSLIRKVRGKTTLEALHRLQGGLCAYDQRPCVLLLPQAVTLYSHSDDLQLVRGRFATLDHVQPRFLGGSNSGSNLVMASQAKNNEKGCLPPLDQWTPEFRHSEAEITEMVKIVEHTRWLIAQQFAEDRKLNKQDVIDKLVKRELRRLSAERDFKFYDDYLAMVA